MDGKMGEWEQNNLIKELTQGRELAKLLQIQFNTPSSSSLHDQTRGMLVQNIISSFEKAISILKPRSSSSSTQDLQLSGLVIESPPSLTLSPRSDQDSDRDVKDPLELKNGSKKSKTFPKWTQKVKVIPGAGLEGPLDDGFSWRKYGQKEIHGSKYPRGYYRCTQRNGKGCLATKQVQRSDEDTTIFEITYRGNHTCTQEPNTTIEPQQQPSPFPPFHFPSPSPLPSIVINSNFAANFSPSFISPQASGSTNYNVQSSAHDSELNEPAAAASTSATNSPTVDLDYPFGDIEYDPNFTFDNLGLFSSFQPFDKQSK